ILTIDQLIQLMARYSLFGFDMYYPHCGTPLRLLQCEKFRATEKLYFLACSSFSSFATSSFIDSASLRSSTALLTISRRFTGISNSTSVLSFLNRCADRTFITS